jgi:hypothetical protein
MQKIIFAVAALAISSPAVAADHVKTTWQLPDIMVGRWNGSGSGVSYDKNNWPGDFVREPGRYSDWRITKDTYEPWDGTCKIHDVKELGEDDYEV